MKSKAAENKILFSLLIVLLVASIPAVYLANWYGLISSWQDDSFYYLVPAWHWAKEGKISADGIGETYGYQPAWMLIQTAVCKVTPTIQSAFLWVCILQRWIFFWSCFLIVRASRNLWGASSFWYAVAFTFLAGTGLQNDLFSGKENTFGLLLLAALFHHFSKAKEFNWSACLFLGLLTVCRTSYAPAILLVCIYYLFTKKMEIKHFAVVLAPLLLWSVWAQQRYGVVFPLSGSIKIGQAILTVKSNFQSISSGNFGFIGTGIQQATTAYWSRLFPLFSLGTLGVILVCGAISVLKKDESQADHNAESGIRSFYQILGAIIAINLVGNYFLWPAAMSYFSWYMLPEVFAIVLVSIRLTSYAYTMLVGQHLMLVRVLCVVGLLLAVAFKTREWRTFSPRSAPTEGFLYQLSKDGVEWVNRLPANAAICSFNSGYTSFIFADRKVLNLDGLCAPVYISKSVIRRDKSGNNDPHEAVLWSAIKSLEPAYLLDIQPIEWTSERLFRGTLNLKGQEVIERSKESFVVGPENDYLYLFKLTPPN